MGPTKQVSIRRNRCGSRVASLIDVQQAVTDAGSVPPQPTAPQLSSTSAFSATAAGVASPLVHRYTVVPKFAEIQK